MSEVLKNMRTKGSNVLGDGEKIYRVAQKLAQFLYAVTLPNINRFSNLFHCQNQEKICNCVATLPCEMSSGLKATIEKRRLL